MNARWAMAAILFVAGCGGGGDPDAGRADGAPLIDAMIIDARVVDAPIDAAPPDAFADAGPPDACVPQDLIDLNYGGTTPLGSRIDRMTQQALRYEVGRAGSVVELQVTLARVPYQCPVIASPCSSPDPACMCVDTPPCTCTPMGLFDGTLNVDAVAGTPQAPGVVLGSVPVVSTDVPVTAGPVVVRFAPELTDTLVGDDVHFVLRTSSTSWAFVPSGGNDGVTTLTRYNWHVRTPMYPTPPGPWAAQGTMTRPAARVSVFECP